MPTLEEAANTFGSDMQAMNIAGLMMAFTPEGMMKAMAMQQQMQTRAAEAIAAGRTPAPVSSYSLDMQGAEGDDQLIQLNLESADGVAEVLTKWREVAGIWKVNDLSVLAMKNSDGSPAALPGA